MIASFADQLQQKLEIVQKSKHFSYETNTLAGIFVDGKLISFAIGSKCLPDCKIPSEIKSFLVRDMHAEILAKRAFSRWLMIEMQKRGQIDVKNVILAVSRAPCGDCSVDSLLHLMGNGDEEVNSEQIESQKECTTQIEREKNCTKNANSNSYNQSNTTFRSSSPILHGHELLKIKGATRTKPGRKDSPPTKILSCSDKIAKWIHGKHGLESSLLKSLVSSPIKLNGIFIGSLFNRQSIERALFLRFSKPVPNDFLIEEMYFHPLSQSIFKCSQGDCICWWIESEEEIEFLNTDGIRQGGILKQIPKCASKICDSNLEKLCESLVIELQ